MARDATIRQRSEVRATSRDVQRRRGQSYERGSESGGGPCSCEPVLLDVPVDDDLEPVLREMRLDLTLILVPLDEPRVPFRDGPIPEHLLVGRGQRIPVSG